MLFITEVIGGVLDCITVRSVSNILSCLINVVGLDKLSESLLITVQ